MYSKNDIRVQNIHVSDRLIPNSICRKEVYALQRKANSVVLKTAPKCLSIENAVFVYTKYQIVMTISHTFSPIIPFILVEAA